MTDGIPGHADRSPPGDPGETESGESASRNLTDGGTSVFDGERGPGGPGGPDGSEGDHVEPVEVLVQLAEDGEIDPWDIDVVRVTDKFLDRIDESDLRTSGRALFYASVLVRMKSDAMLEPDDPEADEPEPWEAALGEGGPQEGMDVDVDPFDQLGAEMDRRLERKRARGMPQTLDELVRDLREAERGTWWKESREYDTSDSPSGYGRGTQELDYHGGDDRRMDDEPTVADVTGTAHGEDVEELVGSVREAVASHYDEGRGEVLFLEVESAAGSRVETFLALLFLSHRGDVRLCQGELFGDLWIQDPDADFDRTADPAAGGDAGPGANAAPEATGEANDD